MSEIYGKADTRVEGVIAQSCLSHSSQEEEQDRKGAIGKVRSNSVTVHLSPSTRPTSQEHIHELELN